MNRLRLSFVLRTSCDPSTVLDVLQQFAPDIARALESYCDEEDLNDDEAAAAEDLAHEEAAHAAVARQTISEEED